MFLITVGNNSDVKRANITYAEEAKNRPNKAIITIMVPQSGKEKKNSWKQNKIIHELHELSEMPYYWMLMLQANYISVFIQL